MDEVLSEHHEVHVLLILHMPNLRFIMEHSELKHMEWMDVWNKLKTLQVIISEKYS
jgi:hypothetical protein